MKIMQQLCTLMVVCGLLLTTTLQAQEAKGKITVGGKSNYRIEQQKESVVHHYADFRTGKHPVVFSLSSKGYALTSDKKEVVLVSFETIVQADGKQISRSKGKPIPYFPGEMGMPVETFDFIPVIFDHQNGRGTKDDKGFLRRTKNKPVTYEIEIRAETLNGKGNIAPAMIVWII